MRSTTTTAVLTLCALVSVACSADNAQDPLSPTYSQRNAVAAAANRALPFAGVVAASETHTISNDGIFFGHVVGTGTATQLGRFTLQDDEVGNPATLAGNVTIILTAANGDVLTATGTAQAALSADYLTLTNVETATITGGTGRFAGATGNFVLERVIDLSLGSPYHSTGSLNGNIMLAD